MSGQTYTTVNTADGKAVANAIGGLYVNSYSNPGKRFYECMSETKAEIQRDFTMLCFEWFVNLANVMNYDERNKSAVYYAREIKGIFNDVAFKEKSNIVSKGSIDFIFNYRDDEAAVQVIDTYLSFSKDNTDFISCMLQQHRTLQQSFSRLCCNWFEYVSEKGTNEPYVMLAKKAAEQYKGFRLI